MKPKTKTKSSATKVVKDIRRANRKLYSAEEKIRIVLEGLRGENSIAELCRIEGIAQSMYYSWSKEFLEAGKQRLSGDTARAATTDEVKTLRGMISRQKIEGEFETLLKTLQPAPKMSALFRAMFKDCWEMFRQDAAASIKAVKAEILGVEKQITKMVDKIVDANNPRVISAFEKRIDELETRQLVLREKSAQNGQPLASFGKMFELSMQFLSNPHKIWASGRFDLQRLVLKLAFSDHLTYSKEKGFLNTKNAFPFNAIGSFCGSKNKMVPFLNSLFEELADWEHQLKPLENDLKDELGGPEL